MYYIDPWVFYIIGLIVHIQIACICFAVAGGIIWAIGLLVGPVLIDDITDAKEKRKFILKLSGNG